MTKFPKIDQEDLKLISYGYALREIYWPHYTWNIQTKKTDLINSKTKLLVKRNINIKQLQQNWSYLFDKINASFYHLEKLKENEKIITDLGKKMASKKIKRTPNNLLAMIGLTFEPINYEYESILVSIKSTLDILGIIISPACGMNKTDNILVVVDNFTNQKVNKKYLITLKKHFQKSSSNKLLNEYRKKNDKPSKRNFTVHQGSLPTGTLNIQFLGGNPQITIKKTTINGNEIAKFSKNKSVVEYCEWLFYSTCNFIIHALEIVFDEQLSHGEKISVYQAKNTN